MKTLSLTSFIFLIGSIFANFISAENPLPSAKEFLKQQHNEMNSLIRKMNKQGKTQNNEPFKKSVQTLLDFQELSKRSLGKHWEKHSKDEQAQFTALLQKLVEKNYEKNLNQTLNYQIRYLEEEKLADGSVVVKTKAKSKTNKRAPAVTLDYAMHITNNTWKVFDIVTDGASMTRSYRSQFNRILRKQGWSGLMEKMDSKLEPENTK